MASVRHGWLVVQWSSKADPGEPRKRRLLLLTQASSHISILFSMQLGVNLVGRNASALAEVACRAERLGFDSVWRGEAYGGDAATVLAFAAAHTSTIRLGTAILQMPARTPATTAMTAISLDHLSGGRAVLGLGTSGPQVVEGWHGVAFPPPLAFTEEYVAVVRQVLRGDERVEHDGRLLHVPFRGEGSTGLGKALRPGMHTRADIPIHLAAIGPRNVALATRIADGLLPMLWDPYRWETAFGDALRAAPGGFEISPTVPVAVGDDVAACRDRVRPVLGLYIGGMGAKGRNFYNDLVRRYGWESVAEDVQDRYLAGDRKGALAAIPDDLVDELALVGDRGRIADQLAAWQASGVTRLVLADASETAMTTVAELVGPGIS
jgi:F420-dependent oxidoreductase-like protein